MSFQPKPLPSQSRLLELLDYDPESGGLTWKTRPGDDRGTRMFNWRFAGKPAGCQDTGRGYVMVCVEGQQCLAHRVITKIMTGHDPSEFIDHVDGDPNNNRWVNLRPATYAENQWNRRSQLNNTSGFKGVSRSKGRWRAEICREGVRHHLGTFNTPEAAYAAYCAAADRLHGEFARFG